LQDTLIDSGNKFILDLFKTPGLVTVGEATKNVKVFDEAMTALNVLGISIKKDIAGVKGIQELFKKEFPEEGLLKERAIDVRISSVGVGKRGLQPEFLESIVNNIISAGPRGTTTVPTTDIPYQGLLSAGGKRGKFADISKSLGFETIRSEVPEGERKQVIEQLLFKRLVATGKTPEEAKVIAERGAALEAVSDFYTTIIDEFGERRKSIVGEKFLSVVEEPGQFAPTTSEDIRRREAGAKVKVPVFAAYASVFGEKSK
ncbi:unnamed protein product, partial [marine sediment metagenome]